MKREYRATLEDLQKAAVETKDVGAVRLLLVVYPLIERLEALVEEMAGIHLALVNRSVPPGEGRTRSGER